MHMNDLLFNCKDLLPPLYFEVQCPVFNDLLLYLNFSKYGFGKGSAYWKHLRQHSLFFNKQNKILHAISGKFKQSTLKASDYNPKSAPKEYLQKEYTVNDEAWDVKEFVCPDGYKERITDGQTFCSPIFTEHEILKAKGSHCAGMY